MSARENTFYPLVSLRILSGMCLVILTIRLCVVWKDTRIVVVLAYLNFGVSIRIYSNGITNHNSIPDSLYIFACDVRDVLYKKQK